MINDEGVLLLLGAIVEQARKDIAQQTRPLQYEKSHTWRKSHRCEEPPYTHKLTDCARDLLDRLDEARPYLDYDVAGQLFFGR